MKKSLLCATALAVLAFASTASAADLPSRRVIPAYVPVFTWTGFYVGANAGYAFGMDKVKNVDVFYYDNSIYPLDSAHSTKDGGFTGGAQIGYNYQMGSFVIGAEADFNYADLRSKYDGRSDFLVPGDLDGAYTVSVRSELKWFGTVRARVGFTPVDRLLVYATGGLAYGQVKTRMDFVDYFDYEIDGQGHGSKSSTRVGWTLGAGVEYAITDNLTLRGEYAYVGLGDKSHRWDFLVNTMNGPEAGSYMSAKDNGNFQVVRAGLNYKF